jgi:hypothetical protein
MENRISGFYDNLNEQREERGHHDGPQPIGEILAELLAQYEARFPAVRFTVVETPVAAA